MPQNKPTKEELKAQEEEAVKIAEELEGRQTIPQDEEEPEVPEDENSEVVDETEEEGQEEEESPDETEAETPEVEQADPSKELFKKKASASAREAQKIHAKNRVINKALSDAEEIPEPTEEELEAEFKDWDVMSDTEKMLAKETVVSRNWRKVISSAKEQATKIEKWNDSVDEYVSDPKTLIDHPELEGKAEEFKEFATQETNNSVPFNILVSAFLHDHSTTVKPNKGRMFERGLGGSNERPKLKDGKISLEEARVLRETDYNAWKEKLDQGKIEIAV